MYDIPFLFQLFAEQHCVRANGLSFRYTPHHKDLSVTAKKGFLPTALLKHSSGLISFQAFHREEKTLEPKTLMSKSPNNMSRKGMLPQLLPFLMIDLTTLFLMRTFHGSFPSIAFNSHLEISALPCFFKSLIPKPPCFLGVQHHSHLTLCLFLLPSPSDH